MGNFHETLILKQDISLYSGKLSCSHTLPQSCLANVHVPCELIWWEEVTGGQELLAILNKEWIYSLLSQSECWILEDWLHLTDGHVIIELMVYCLECWHVTLLTLGLGLFFLHRYVRCWYSQYRPLRTLFRTGYYPQCPQDGNTRCHKCQLNTILGYLGLLKSSLR